MAVLIPFQSRELDAIRKAQLRAAPAVLKAHTEWIEKIPGGRLIVIPENSSHGTIIFEDPALVVRTIREAVEKSKR